MTQTLADELEALADKAMAEILDAQPVAYKEFASLVWETLPTILSALRAREPSEEMVARAIHEADPDVGVSWDEWLAYALEHPDHMQSIEYTRRSARAAIHAMENSDAG